MMKEMLGNSYLFGVERAVHRGALRGVSEGPGSRSSRAGASYFDELQRLDDGAADVSHVDVQERFVELARERRAGRADGGHQPPAARREAVRRAAADRRLPLPRRAPRRRRSARAPGEAGHPRARSGVLRPDRSRHGHGVQHRDAGRAARDEAARHPAVPEGHLLPHHRRRVHVHHRHGAEALGAGAPGERARDAVVRRRVPRSTSSSASPPPRRSSATCTRATSGRSASRSKAARR